MKLLAKLLGADDETSRVCLPAIQNAVTETKSIVSNVESTMKKLDAALDAASVQPALPTMTEKRKAAMSLNLCATSISRILSSDDLEVMDVEYETILNNLNLQNMLKDEALLSTFKSILDTITFYRLQAGDKRRAEIRYRQQLNNAIWSASSQGACLLFASAANPTPWAIVSGAVMAVGAFCNVKKAKADATVAHDDAKWKLERSLIEQLHALRYSLFETSWRLADRYDFEEAWRLTAPQIDQYNKILFEPDPAWRYFKLIQYKKSFEAYPYYWNELGESAFRAAVATEDEALRADYLEKAESAFNAFAERDMGLLREDMIAAAAYLRRVQIAYKRNLSWTTALGDANGFADKIAGLACSAPDLLMQGAICLSAGYEESKDKSYLARAISLLEMVVSQEYDIPSSSRLLSKLYLESDDYKIAYETLRCHVGAIGVVSPDDTTGRHVIELDCAQAKRRLENVLPVVFDHAIKMSNGGLFNGSKREVDAKVAQFIGEKSLKLDSSVVDMLMGMWVDIKAKLNAELLACSNSLGCSPESLSIVAKEINASVQNEIKTYSGSIGNLISSNDRSVQQQRSVNRILVNAKKLFVTGIVDAVMNVYDVRRYEDVEEICEGVSSIERHVAEEKQRYGIVSVSEQENIDVFALQVEESQAGHEIDWTEYKKDPSWGEKMIDEHKGFRVKTDSLGDVFSASHQLEDDLERKGYRVRVYTQANMVACAYLPLGAAWLAHRLVTINPDFEVIRYPKSVEVKYMHDDIHDTSSESGFFGKIVDDLGEDVNGIKRFAGEFVDKCTGLFKS